MRQVRNLFAILSLVFIVACQALAPTNFQESLLATETAITTVRQTGEQAALAGKLTKAQAQYVQNQADLAVSGVKAARDMKNPAGAQDQLTLTLNILKAIQSFLLSHGASK